MLHRFPFLGPLLALIIFCGGAYGDTLADSGPIIDRVGILDHEMTTAISSWLESYRQRSGNRVLVVTVDELDEEAIADMRLQFLTGAGMPERTVLLLVAPAIRKAAIAVGDGLRQKLTPEAAGEIVERDLASDFTADRLPGRLNQGIADVIDALDHRPATTKAGDDPLARIVPGWPLLALFVVAVLAISGLRGVYRKTVAARLRARNADVNRPASVWWNDDLEQG